MGTASCSVATATDLPKLADQISVAHSAVMRSVSSALECARDAGELLIEAKQAIGHGKWGRWLRANFEFSERTARAYMRVAKRWPEIEAKRQSTADLSIAEALKLLTVRRSDEGTWDDRLADLQERFEEADQTGDLPALVEIILDGTRLANEAAEDKIRCERAMGEILNSCEHKWQRDFLLLIAQNPDFDWQTVLDNKIAELTAANESNPGGDDLSSQLMAPRKVEECAE